MRTRARPAGSLGVREAAATIDLAIAALGCWPSCGRLESGLCVPPLPPQVPARAAINSEVIGTTFNVFLALLKVRSRLSNPHLIAMCTVEFLILLALIHPNPYTTNHWPIATILPLTQHAFLSLWQVERRVGFPLRPLSRCRRPPLRVSTWAVHEPGGCREARASEP